MQKIELKNREVIEALNEYKDFIWSKIETNQINEDLIFNCQDHTRDRWIADDYRDRIIARHNKHDGFPESLRNYKFTQPDVSSETSHGNLYKKAEPYRDAAIKLNTTLMTTLSTRRNSLCAVYPPGGWISWHNNANAYGYNILFTWSEKGDGCFKYWDMEKGKEVIIQDEPGWQCKMGYFGGYHEDRNKLCYHAAHNDDWRITVAYIFVEAEEFWKEVVEDIQTE